MSIINRRIEKNMDMKKKITTMIKKEVRNDKKNNKGKTETRTRESEM